MKEDYRSLAAIAENLSQLYEDGIPITKSIELLEELPLSKEYKKSLRNIKEDVIQGNSLGYSLYKNPILYPKFFSGIVDIGEKSGRLEEMLKNLRDFYFNIDRVRKKVRGALSYPLFIMMTLLCLVIVFFIIIIPNLYETFASMNKDMPFIIKEVYKVYSSLIENKIYSISLFISMVGCFILIIKYIKSENKELIDTYLMKIKIIRQYYECIFMMVIAIVMCSGMHINEGLDLCIESINIKSVRAEMIKLKGGILQGNDFKSSLSESSFLSKYSLSMIEIGDKSGNLDEILKKTSLRLEQNLIGKLNKTISYVTPAAICIVAFFIIIFIFLFIIPMLDMVYSGVM